MKKKLIISFIISFVIDSILFSINMAYAMVYNKVLLLSIAMHQKQRRPPFHGRYP